MKNSAVEFLACKDTVSRVTFRLRIDVDDEPAFGPGKIRLLESILETGNVGVSAKALGMSFNRAWLLIHEMNQLLDQPVLLVNKSDKDATRLSDAGLALLREFRQLETEVHQATQDRMGSILKLLKKELVTF